MIFLIALFFLTLMATSGVPQGSHLEPLQSFKDIDRKFAIFLKFVGPSLYLLTFFYNILYNKNMIYILSLLNIKMMFLPRN